MGAKSDGGSEMVRFRNAIDLFRTYGDKYDLPWLLVAAQGYQESGIDQSKRSPVGAVGVMQIKPSTAEGAPIHITGVDADMDRNIEAGAKYLRFIIDRYYADEPLDTLNKGLFPVRLLQSRFSIEKSQGHVAMPEYISTVIHSGVCPGSVPVMDKSGVGRKRARDA